MKFDYEPDSKSKFLNLKDGDKFYGVFRGEPFVYRVHWVNKKSSRCAGNGCELCKTDKARFRFKINFLLNINNTWECKIFEGGRRVYNTLKALHESEYNLEKTIVAFSRSGSSKDDTSYNVLPVKDCDVTPEREAVLSMITLHSLGQTQDEQIESSKEDFPL